MLTLLKHHLLESHFHAMPHGLASWLDRELQSRLQEMQCASQCGRGTVAKHFKVKDFLGNAVDIVSNQPVKNAKEKLMREQQHGKANCLLFHQNGSTQTTRTKRNDLTTSIEGSSLVLGHHSTDHHSSPAYYFGAKMHLEGEQLDSFALNAPLSWQAATDNNILALKKRTTTDLDTWSAFDEVENEVAVALPIFPNSSPVCHLGNNMRRNVIGVKQHDSGYRDTFVDNTASNNNAVVGTPSPEPFRSDSGQIVLRPEGGDVANSMKVQTPSPEPSWSRLTCCKVVAGGQILHGTNIILMDVRTPSPEHLSSNDEEACCSAQETVPQKNNHLFGAGHKSPKKLKLNPSSPVATDTTRKTCYSHQGVLLIPSPENDAIVAEVCHTHALRLQLSASQTDDENGIKTVVTPNNPEHCNEQERDKYDQASLDQSPHFTGTATTLKATSPLYSGRHKKRYCSRPSSQSPAFLSLWAREEAARQVKGQEGGQTPLLPSNYFYVEQRESSSPCSLEVESSHLGKALELQDDGSKSALSLPANDLVSPTTPCGINDSIADDNHPQHVMYGHGDCSASSLPMGHSYSRKSNSKRSFLEHALLD